MYGDFVMSVDHVVGAILDELDKLEMADDTMVVFTSDNGPVWYDNDEEKYDHVSTGPLLGMKGDAWEGGHRMPYIVRWPGRVEAGAVNGRLIAFTDVMATFAEMTGQELPKNAAEDSFSFYGALVNRAPTTEQRSNFLIRSSAFPVIRSDRWVLIEGLGSGGFSQPRRINPEKGGPTGQLYDLNHDVGQRYNMWSANPDVVIRLRAEMKKYLDAGRSRGVK
jgi:arylsulfatase A-like enzyme